MLLVDVPLSSPGSADSIKFLLVRISVPVEAPFSLRSASAVETPATFAATVNAASRCDAATPTPTPFFPVPFIETKPFDFNSISGLPVPA